MPVAGEPMGIEAAEEPLVGTPDGDPFTLAHFSRGVRSVPPSLPPRPALLSSLPSTESWKSRKADRTALYHVSSFLLPSSLPRLSPNSPSNILGFCHFSLFRSSRPCSREDWRK